MPCGACWTRLPPPTRRRRDVFGRYRLGRFGDPVAVTVSPSTSRPGAKFDLFRCGATTVAVTVPSWLAGDGHCMARGESLARGFTPLALLGIVGHRHRGGLSSTALFFTGPAGNPSTLDICPWIWPAKSVSLWRARCLETCPRPGHVPGPWPTVGLNATLPMPADCLMTPGRWHPVAESAIALTGRLTHGPGDRSGRALIDLTTCSSAAVWPPRVSVVPSAAQGLSTHGGRGFVATYAGARQPAGCGRRPTSVPPRPALADVYLPLQVCYRSPMSIDYPTKG